MAGALVPAAQTGLSLLNAASIARSLGLTGDVRSAFNWARQNIAQSRARYGNLRRQIQARHSTSAPRTTASSGTGRPNKNSMPYRRSYKRGRKAPARKARKIRKADKMIKKAKKRRNYKVLSKIPRPIGGLEARKCVRLIVVENSFMHWGPPSGVTITHGMTLGGGGGYPKAADPVTHAPQYRTFCLNDLGTPWNTTDNRGGGWRPHYFWNAEGGDPEKPSTDGHVPGWKTWAGFYDKAEIIGCKAKVRFTNTTRDSAIQSPALVGYNVQHDRTEAGNAYTVHQQLNNFGTPDNPPATRQIHTAEDLERAKIFSTSVVKPEAPGDVKHFTINYSTRKAFPNVSGSTFQTSQTTATGVTDNPGPIKNKSYLTLCACPVLNASGVQHYSIGYSIEMEFLVLYSELQETYKTTAQILSGNFSAQVVPA